MKYCRVAPDVKLGKDVKIHGFVNAYGCAIDDNTRVGAFVEIQKGVQVGANCKISSHTFICEGVTIENDVFIGHNVTFINDRHPRAINSNGEPQTEEDWRLEKITVCQGASIGSSSCIMCGVVIGKGAMVGAGSLVTKDIPDGEIWIGHPAKFLKKVS